MLYRVYTMRIKKSMSTWAVNISAYKSNRARNATDLVFTGPSLTSGRRSARTLLYNACVCVTHSCYYHNYGTIVRNGAMSEILIFNIYDYGRTIYWLLCLEIYNSVDRYATIMFARKIHTPRKN